MHHPPKYIERFLRWFCNPSLYEELAGDLQESYELNRKAYGKSYAVRHYLQEVVRLLRPSVIKKMTNRMHVGWTYDMLQNICRMAYRNMGRDRVSAWVNVTGLSLALVAALFIFLFVQNEMAFDQEFTEGDRIFRITNDERPHRQSGRYLATVSPPFAPTLASEYPEIEAAVRLRLMDDVILKYGSQTHYESNGIYVDPDFLKLFDFELISGKMANILEEPNSIVLTPSLATKYFGDVDPMGKSVLFEGDRELKVTGVLQNDPAQTHLDFDFLVSFSTFQVPYGYPVTLDSWGWISFHTYVLLQQGVDPATFEEELTAFAQRHIYSDRDVTATFRLQPLSEIYFGSADLMNTGDFNRGNRRYTYGLAAIAFMILLVAGFNYMNISTARSIKRAEEVGVRKVLGARHANLVSQFIGESVAISMLSFCISLALFEVSRPVLSRYLGWEFDFEYQQYLYLVPVIFLTTCFLGIAASVYPAGVLASYKPVQALQGIVRFKRGQLSMRKVLVLFQFGITVILIICTLVVSRQMHYIEAKSPGYDREHLVYLQLQSDDFLQRYPAAKALLLQHPEVLSVTAGDAIDGDYGSVPITVEGSDRGVAMNMMGGYFDYFTTLGVEIIEGRDFSALYPDDTLTGIIINESVVAAFGWDQPLNKRLQVNSNIQGQVIGVVRDFHFHSLHDPIGPMVTVVPRTHMSNIILRIAPVDDLSAFISTLERDWKKIAADHPFDFHFVDDDVQSTYQSDQLFAQMITFFSAVAIFIAGLGLYGLVTIISAYRTKEIGIRKVLGATVWSISFMLSRNFLLLIVISNCIAVPLGWWAMDNWLENFAYRIEIQGSYFFIALCFSILIAILSISYQVFRAGKANPVASLREY